MAPHEIPEKKIAVLIDAENSSPNTLGLVLDELKKHGTVSLQRAYADWTNPSLKNWKEITNTLSISTVQQFSYTKNKNSSDMALVIDAIDLLYTERYDTFAIISSDSDFTRLASRLRESNIYVFCVGEQKKAPDALINACDTFIQVELLSGMDSKQDSEKQAKGSESPRAIVKKSKKELLKNKKLINKLTKVVSESEHDSEGYARLGSCGILLKRISPDFDPRTYGYRQLSKLFEASELFDIIIKDGASVIRLKNE